MELLALRRMWEADGEVIENGAGIILDSHKVTSQLCTLLPLFVEHPEMAKIIGIKARQRVLDRYTLIKILIA